MNSSQENISEDQERISSPTSSLSASDASLMTGSEQIISDVVGFSLCSLSRIRLNYLYPEDCHEIFKKSTIKRMIDHFGLPQKVEYSILEFVAEDEFTFLSSIKHNHKGNVFRLIEELILLSISTGTYDARMHYLIINIAELLGIPRELVEIHCESIYELLLNAKAPEKKLSEGNSVSEATDNDEADAESRRYKEKRDSRKKLKKYLMIGLASLGGGAVIGVTGGLAAPIVASAFGAAIGAGTFVMSSAAAGVVGSLFGVAGAGLTASKMQKRIGDLEEFAFESLNPQYDQTSLTITIAISGWVTEEGECQFKRPWKCLNHTSEQYCLRYESKYLLELSQAMDYLLSFVVSYAAQEALKYTFLAGVMAAIAWPTALISMANIIDNPWDVCIGRSAEAGKHLADVLMARQQGCRPVSLIGFSLGARVIYFCLQELAQRSNSEGIVGDVVMLGAPVTASQDQWRPLGRVISGQVINGYSSSDWLLKFLYRTSSAAIRVAGLQQLCWQDRRVKNVDLTALVTGHMDYYKKLREILEFLNIRTFVLADADEEKDLALKQNVGARSNLPQPNTIIGTDHNESDRSPTNSTTSGIGRSASQQSSSSTTMDEISTSFSQQSLTQSNSAHSQTKEPIGAVIDPLAATRIAPFAADCGTAVPIGQELEQQDEQTATKTTATARATTTTTMSSAIANNGVGGANRGLSTAKACAGRKGLARQGSLFRCSRLVGSLAASRLIGGRANGERELVFGQAGGESRAQAAPSSVHFSVRRLSGKLQRSRSL